ncbi:hypothetical protein ACH4LK_22595 [Streptomyces lydicus]|uniref:hypothetical protein n=1 Tax=Streptomyces lydicus TaxID=47763 RepID=UPI003799976F
MNTAEQNSAEILAATPTVTVTLPGSFCTWLDGTGLAQGQDDSDPECKALRLAYDAAPLRRNGKSYYVKITTGDDAVLKVLAEYGGYCNDSNIDEPDAAEVRAAHIVEARAIAARKELRAAQEAARAQQAVEAEPANAHDADEPIPAEVLAAAPGTVIVTHDHGMKHDVWRDGGGLGALFDETPANLARGGWAAWSPKCSNKGGIIGFYATKEEAAAAVAEAWPAPAAEEPAPADPEPEELDVHVVSYLGGKVHTLMPGQEEHPYPLCRGGGMNQQVTKFRITSEPLSCSRCVEYARRRAARASA